MLRDDVERALDAMASEVAAPSANAGAVVERGRRRTRQRRIALVGVVASVVAVVAAVGVFAQDDNSKTPPLRTVEHRTPPVAGARSTEIAAPAPNEAWKCRNPIEYTSDGGQSWRATKLPGSRNDGVLCAAIAGGTAWAVAADAAGHERIFRIRDGGAHVDTFALPRSMAGGLTAPTFIDADHGWIDAVFPRASENRIVYRTIDGGATWARVAQGRLYALSFASPEVGWSTDGSNVLRTSDGGETWHATHHVSERLFQLVATTDGAVAWGGRLIQGAQYKDFFDVTTDGGKTWTRRGTPDFEVPNGMNFFNATDATHWQQASGNALRVTSDAGRTWEMRPDMPGGVNGPLAVRFVTADVFWFTNDQGDVFRTTDGGLSWDNVTTGGEHPFPAPPRPVPIPLAFVSPTEGWLCSGPTMLYTTDAGAHWKNVAVPSHPPAPPRMQNPVCAAIPGGEAWMLTTSTDYAREQLIHVSDHGRQVESFAFPQLANEYQVRALMFADSKRGWAISNSPQGDQILLATTDGGQTWNVDLGQGTRPLRFSSPSNGWGATYPPGAEVAHTIDGGRTWQYVSVPAPDAATNVEVSPIAARGDLVVAVVRRPDGAIPQLSFDVSRDNGRSWTLRPVPGGDRYPVTTPTAFGVTDADHWQLAFGSRLETTADGGRTWKEVANFAALSQITDIAFLTPRLGVVSGIGAGESANASMVLQTSDAGSSWATIDNNAPPLASDANVVNFPGGIIGCPTQGVTPEESGDPPPGLVAAAVRNIETTRGWKPATITHVYRVGAAEPDSYAEIFAFQLGSCPYESSDDSWVVEVSGPVGQGGGGSTEQAQVVLAHYADGWHVYGRYH